MNYDYHFDDYYISLYPNSEHLKGIFQGYIVYASITRETAREVALINPQEEYFLFGIISDYLYDTTGIIRIEAGKITGFYPMDDFITWMIHDND